MNPALRAAATGMMAQQTRTEIISNNLANVNTPGFKRSRAHFEDLLYQTVQGQQILGDPDAEARAAAGDDAGLAREPHGALPDIVPWPRIKPGAGGRVNRALRGRRSGSQQALDLLHAPLAHHVRLRVDAAGEEHHQHADHHDHRAPGWGEME